MVLDCHTHHSNLVQDLLVRKAPKMVMKEHRKPLFQEKSSLNITIHDIDVPENNTLIIASQSTIHAILAKTTQFVKLYI